MTEETDVIERVINGDTEAFRVLIERYQGPVIRMIANMTGNGQDCESLAQDVFLAAYAKLKTFDPARSLFSTWLFTIARNKSINALRKQRLAAGARPPQRADTADPSETLARREALARLDEALAALPGRQRRALVLVEFEGLSYDEAAQVEGTRIGTIRSRISRARKALMNALGHLGADEPC